MNEDLLNINQSPSELNQIYCDNYYWYLKSAEFVSSFLRPLARFALECGAPILDVGCGEGWLSNFFPYSTAYTGIDGSQEAIKRAKQRHGNFDFRVARFESFTDPEYVFKTIIFGGIFSVLVKPGKRKTLIEHYMGFSPDFFIVYDLETLDTSEFDGHFKKVEDYHATAEVDGLQDIKKHRKILVYQCP